MKDDRLRVNDFKPTLKSLKLTSIHFVTFLIINVSCNLGDRG